ncbi:MAG: SHOCT domain-containing protein [Planctomycetes bacterium]|uniref:SHOCT domain-containing protein n=1 Tax=Candidatus Wunengus californicus TaxID=3367619 RepID=UPI0040294787|nr:SHOCT domain-containing protein [Planctomycetota bacterium]
MKEHILKRTILIVGFICMVSSCRVWNIHADTYKDGMITVKHEELPVKRNGSRIQLNHPYEMVGNVITNALSYIYYEERGLLKKKGSLRVFQDDEIKKLVPLIVQAFSAATPTQVVAVSSYSERMLLTDQQNYCILFISEHSLNIAFSRIHMFQTYNDAMSEKKRNIISKENPATINHSRFWKLVPSSGQRLEPDHENWLVIDLSDEMYQQPVAQRVGTVDEKIKMGTSELDTRLKRLEERMSNASIPKQLESTSPAREIRGESKIKIKLIILRELVDDGVISEEDYDYKKAKMLREAMSDMSIKEQLREIKDLMVEGLITENDYNEKKKELLDQF